MTEWRGLALRVRAELRDCRASLMAAGVAYFAFLALAPGLAAVVSLYGLVAEPADVDRHVGTAFELLPDGARQVLADQLAHVAAAPPGTLGGSLALAVAIALWSASRGIGHLLEAVRAAYGSPVPSKVRARALAYWFTAATLIGGAGAVTAVAVVPGRFPAGAIRLGVRIGLWMLVAALVLAWLEALYRAARSGDAAAPTGLARGSLVALVLLVAAMAAMNLYVAAAGSYDATYGALAGVVVLLLWLHLAALIVLIGAYVNADHADHAEDPTESVDASNEADVISPR